jgi:hypothetical protein
MSTSGQMISHAFEDWSNGTGYVASLFSDEMTRQIVGHWVEPRKYANSRPTSSPMFSIC